MFRRHVQIASRPFERGMHVWQFGNFGAPILVLPSASGMAHEWDVHGMVEALAPLINGGKIKLYCSESNVAEAWTRREGDVAWRQWRHRLFEQYVVNELVPWIREDCQSPGIRLALAGTSLGAFYAANFALKYPEPFHYALCMSGRYDVSWLVDGYRGPELYFNNPLWYVPNLAGDPLERVRRNTHLTLVCGRGRWEDGNIEETEALAAQLATKGVSHYLDMWGRDVDHSWEWWRRQAIVHLNATFGVPR